jgi:hypothetical protein
MPQGTQSERADTKGPKGRSRRMLLTSLRVALVFALVLVPLTSLVPAPAVAAHLTFTPGPWPGESGGPERWVPMVDENGWTIRAGPGGTSQLWLRMSSGIATPAVKGTLPTVFIASTDDDIFFRFRVLDTPYPGAWQGQGFYQIAAATENEGTWNTAFYIGLDARQQTNNRGKLFVSIVEGATEHQIYPPSATPGPHIHLMSAPDGEDNAWWVSYQVPIDALVALVPGLTRDTALRFFYGTSVQSNSINRDTMDGTGVISFNQIITVSLRDVDGPIADAAVVRIIGPAEGSTVYTPHPTIAGTTKHPGMTVTVYLNNAVAGSAVSSSTPDLQGRYLWNFTSAVSLAPGAYTTRAEVTSGDNLATSNTRAFTIAASSATGLAFVAQPVDTAAGVLLPAVTVGLVGSGGSVAEPGHWVELSLRNSDGTPASSVNLAGSLGAFTNAQGVATFSDLSIDEIGDYRLRAASGGLSTATSNVFSILLPPQNAGLPTIAGIPRVDQLLTADPGEWTGVPAPTFSYQWLRCDEMGESCIEIAGAVGDTYLLTPSDLGARLRVNVTGTNSEGSVTATSSPTDTILAAFAPPGASPGPSVEGTPRLDETLTANPGEWTGEPEPELSYQWLRCDAAGNECVEIEGATGSMHLLGEHDIGATLRVRVTGTNSEGSQSLTSGPTAIVESILDGIMVSPSTALIAAGGSQAFTAEAFDRYGNSLGDVTSEASWSISAGGSCDDALCGAITAGNYTVTAFLGDATDTATLTVEAGDLASMVISPSTATIAAGQSQAFSAEGFDAYGNSRGEVTGEALWTITAGGSCEGPACGATLVGNYTVSATIGAASGSAGLTVEAGPLASIVVSPGTATVAAGETQAFSAEGFDAYGNSLGDMTGEAAWTISGAGSCDGAVCGATIVGDYTVSATIGLVTGTATLTIDAGGLASIIVSPSTASITAGGNQSFTAEGFDAYGNSRGDVTSQASWSISAGGSCDGALCGAATVGDYTVTALLQDAEDTATLAVEAGSLASITVSPGFATITAGETQAFTAEGFDAYGNSRGDVTSEASWSVSAGGSCDGALCGATTVGNYTVVAILGDATDTATLTVEAGTLASIIVSPSMASITAGETQAFAAEGFDAYGNSLGDATDQASWSITGDGSCNGSLCGATTVGNYTVTALLGDATDTATLAVEAGTLASIIVSPSMAMITAGETQAFTAEGFDAYGNSLGDATSQASWSITGTGSCEASLCGATTVGDYTVSATIGSVTQSAQLAVQTGPLASVVVSPGTASIAAGETQAFFAEGFDAYGNSRGDVTSEAMWDISGEGSCDGSLCGATAVGTYVVTASIGEVTDSATLMVDPAFLSTIVVSPSAASITAGESQVFTAEGFDAYGNSLGDVTSEALWSISGEGSCDGAQCGATTVGDYTVSATIGNITHSAQLAVAAGPLTSIIVSPSSATIMIGDEQTFTAEGFDAFGNTRGDMTALASWSISGNGSCEASTCSTSAVGTFLVTAAWDGVEGTAELTVEGLMPENTALPSIEGVPRVDQVLTAHPGEWTGEPEPVLSYQWLRCDVDGENCLAIAGATNQTYLLATDDLGATLRVVVTATNAVGSVTATSAQTDQILAAFAAPDLDAVPTITGVTRVDQILTAHPGNWTGEPEPVLTYEWLRCDVDGGNCVAIEGATNVTYLLTLDDLGATLRVNVTGTNEVGSKTVTSEPTDEILDALAPPENVIRPSIRGKTLDGQYVAMPGTWIGVPAPDLTYQWVRCNLGGEDCVSIAGATSSTYHPSLDDVGARLRVEVTGTNEVGSVTAASDATDVLRPIAMAAVNVVGSV